MEAFFTDFQYGDFVASAYGLLPTTISTSRGDEDAEIGMGGQTDEEYVGRRTIPLDYGTTYQDKLEFSIGVIKNPCFNTTSDNIYFSEFEVRSILRQLTGKQFYQNLYFTIKDTSFYSERVHYRVKVTNIEVSKVNGSIIGFNITFTCDSFWGYTDVKTTMYNMTSDKTFKFNNSSDELNDYLYPTIIFTFNEEIDEFILTNVTDSNRKTIFKNIQSNEVITADSFNETIESSGHKSDKDLNPKGTIVHDFNLNWARFLPGQNEITVSHNCQAKVMYQNLRKVVW